MKSISYGVVMLLVGAALGLVGAKLGPEPNAFAQLGPVAPSPRFQISAYAGQTAQGVHHGCYILDTVTGQVWHTRLGGSAEKVSDKLR